MARKCRGLCDGPRFSKKRLSWDKGSFCPMCGEYGVWVKDPTRKKFNDLFIGSVPDPYSYPHHHDIEGKRREVTILLPVKEMVRRDINGTLLQIIKELVSKVNCPCCGTICRSGPLSKTKYNEEKEKTVHTIDEVGINIFGKPKVEPIDSKVERVKPELPERIRLAKDHPEKPGRPKGSEEKMPKIMNMIIECYFDKYDDVFSILQQYNDRGFSYAPLIPVQYEGKEFEVHADTALDRILDMLRGSLGTGTTGEDIARCRKIIVKVLKQFARKYKLEIKIREETLTADDFERGVI